MNRQASGNAMLKKQMADNAHQSPLIEKWRDFAKRIAQVKEREGRQSSEPSARTSNRDRAMSGRSQESQKALNRTFNACNPPDGSGQASDGRQNPGTGEFQK